MQQEIDAVNRLLIHRKKYTHLGIEYYKGAIHAANNAHLILTKSGIGKTNSAIITALLVQHLRPDYVINTGSAGSLKDIFDIGDVVIADRLIYHDVDASAFGYQLGQIPNMPRCYYPDQKLVNILQTYPFPFKTFVGEIISGDTFIASNTAKIKIASYFPDALAVDMEAASIGQSCYRLGIPLVVVKSISDIANPAATESFKKFLLTAARNSALMIQEMIKSFVNKAIP